MFIKLKNVYRFTLVFFLLGFSISGWTKVSIDLDEISKDSVYPKFKHRNVIKNRKIKMKNRYQLSALLGTVRNNPYFDAVGATLSGSYFFTEEHAVELMFSFLSSSASKHSVALNEQTNIKNLSLAPEPQTLIGLSYKITPYYGKISLSKSMIFTLQMYGLIGGGMFNIGGSSFPYINLGIGQTVYIKKNWGVNLDLRALMYSGPDAVSVDLTNQTEQVSADSFDKIFSFNLLLNAGLFYNF